MNSDLYKLLCTQLGKRRKTIGLSKRKIAKKIGVSRGTIINIENGVRVTSFLTMFRYMQALGVSMLDVEHVLNCEDHPPLHHGHDAG